MGKYFGTDGVRGVANKGLTPELAFKLGRCGGYVLTKETKHPVVLVGKDTRISGSMLESAIIAGLLSVGVRVKNLGVIPTPGVSYLTKTLEAQAGVMISASHNPVQDNGIKFFGSDGFKLSDETEEEIERLLESTNDILPRPVGEEVGEVESYPEGIKQYLTYLQTTIDVDFAQLHIALDCAHGATSTSASKLFTDLKAKVSKIGSSPNGKNINDGVGSTHPETLAEFVKSKKAHVGLAFDGDGDRLIAVDEKGNVLDGDQIMFICGKYMHEQGTLKKDTIVSTVMSNLGFYKAVEEKGIQSIQTKVGDRYVVEAMRKGDYALGGEQSGHIVFFDYNTTGDGMLSAIQLVHVMKKTGKKLSELANEMKKYPQYLQNLAVEDKEEIMNHPKVKEVIQEVERDMHGNGRVLVRPSGTEQLVRVMVEAQTDEDCRENVEKIVAVMKSL